MQGAIFDKTAALLERLRGLAPYAAIELLLPGGSLIAFVLWLYRHRHSTGRHA